MEKFRCQDKFRRTNTLNRKLYHSMCFEFTHIHRHTVVSPQETDVRYDNCQPKYDIKYLERILSSRRILTNVD